MATAIIGVGSIGTAVATHLTKGGEDVLVAAHTPSKAQELAAKLNASAADVGHAIDQSDTVIFAVWLDAMKEVISQNADRLGGKIVIDPSNPVAVGDGGDYSRTLPDGVSSGSVIARSLPSGAHFVKAFGTLGSESLASSANRTPEPAVLFYATDDDRAASAVERLISVAGFDPLRAGGVEAAIRIEMFGDLHQFGGLNGRLLNLEEARAALAGSFSVTSEEAR
jgi:8-hydroxy-5-deazaflavin:NADPH oxidoreductase